MAQDGRKLFGPKGVVEKLFDELRIYLEVRGKWVNFQVSCPHQLLDLWFWDEVVYYALVLLCSVFIFGLFL